MEPVYKDELLNEASLIGEDLLGKAIKSDKGWYWETLSWTEETGAQPGVSEGIYSGTSGIVLFFIELFKQTNDPRFKEAALQGMGWVESYCIEKPTGYYAFITGRIGVAYVMLEMHKLTGEKSYQQKAVEIALASEAFLNSSNYIDDLINGASGCLLALIHIHAATGDVRLLPLIDKFTDHLLNRAQVGADGLYWDRDSKVIRGLCGFSHGASGLGFVFLELAHYFQNPAFNWIAEQAFRYENQYFSEKHGNWPDFRKGIYSPKDHKEHMEAYVKSDFSFFTQPRYMLAWCHGAPGIGLARLRAFKLLQDPAYKAELEKAIHSTNASIQSNSSPTISYTICHGVGGNAMLLLEAYRELKDNAYLQAAIEGAKAGIELRKKNGKYFPGLAQALNQEDKSLFMGNAGVGYFYLQCLKPMEVPSIVAPSVYTRYSGASLASYPILGSNKDVLKRRILNKIFPKTLEAFESVESDFTAFLKAESPAQHFTKAFTAFIGTHASKGLREVFEIEKERFLMNVNIESNALLYIEQEALRNQAHTIIGEGDINSTVLKLRSDIKIRNISWTAADKEEEERLMLMPAPEGIRENKLSEFTHAVISGFQKPVKVEKVISELLEKFEVEDPGEREEVKDLVSRQIKEALLAGILVSEH